MANDRPQLIDAALLDAVSAEAAASPRRRRNRNFHPRDDYPAHRLLNAIEPGSYVAPHRHLHADKDETLIVVRGRLALISFDDAGQVVAAIELAPASAQIGADLPHGIWHTVFALEPGTVFFEAKAGPYLPLAADERAPWAPAVGAPEAAAYLQALAQRFP